MYENNIGKVWEEAVQNLVVKAPKESVVSSSSSSSGGDSPI